MKYIINNFIFLTFFLLIYFFSKNNGQTLIDISSNDINTYNKYLIDRNCFFTIIVLSSDPIMYVEPVGDFIESWGYIEKLSNSSHYIYSLDISTIKGQLPILIGNGLLNISLDLNCFVLETNVEIVSLPNYYSKRLPLAPLNMFLFKGLKYYLRNFPEEYITGFTPIAFNSFPITGDLYGGGFSIQLQLFENNLPILIDYNITSNFIYEEFNYSYIVNKFPNVPREQEIFEIGYGYSPLVTITLKTTNENDVAIVFFTNMNDIGPTPIYSNLTHTTYLTNIEFDQNDNTFYDSYIKNGEDYIPLTNDSVKIKEKEINNILYTGFLDSSIPTISNNVLFTIGINSSTQYDFSEYIYKLSNFRDFTTQLSWPYGFEKGSNDLFTHKHSFLLTSKSFYTYFYLEILSKGVTQYYQYIENDSPPNTDITLNSLEIIWLYEFKFLFRFGINSSIQFSCIEINNKIYRQENLVLSSYVSPPPSTEPPIQTLTRNLFDSENDNVFYEIVIDTVFYFPNQYYVVDVYENYRRYYIGDYLNMNPISKIEPPQILKDVDIYSVSNIEYLFNDVDITNSSISNIIYFNFSNQNVQLNRPMALVLLDRVSINNLKNTDVDEQIGTSKLFYSKWNSTKKMFQIEFTIPANTQSGILPWYIAFSSETLINDRSTHRPGFAKLSSPIFNSNNELDPTRLYSSFLKSSDQLYVKTDNFDAYGPIFSNITTIVEKDYVGWILTISDSINGFSYGDITVRGEKDSSIYNFHLTPSNALGNSDKWNSNYQLIINLNSNFCINQTYIITKVKLFDTQGNRASFSVSGSIVEPLENPFINFLNNPDILKVEYNCISSLSDIDGPELYSFDVIQTGSIFEFFFSAIDQQSGLKPNQRPIVYLSTYQLQTLQCISEISFLNETFSNYSCSIEIPYGFGFVQGGEYIVSVYGFINNAGYYSGFSTETLYSLGYNCIFDSIKPQPRLLITGTSSFNENSNELWIFGGEFNIPTVSFQNVSIVYSNGEKYILSIQKSYSSSILINEIKPTSESFTVQVIFYDEFNNAINESNIYTVKPIKLNFIQPKPIPIPNNPTVECKGNPECGGDKNGYCSKSVGCICYSPWVGLDCSSKVIIIPTPTLNKSEPTFEIPILDNQDDNTDDFLYKSLISIVSLRELDFNLNIVNYYTFNNKWNVTKINSYTNQYKTDIIVSPSILSNNQETTTTIIVTLQWFKDSMDITFANQKLNMKASSIKYTIEISNYQFKSKLNQLQLILSASFKSSNTEGICSNKDFGDTTSTDNSNYMKIQIGDRSLYGRFIKRAIIDKLIKSVQNEIINETTLNNYEKQLITERSASSDYSFIGITIPYYRENIILDPDFSILLDSFKVSKSDQGSICNGEGTDPSIKSGLSNGQIAGIIIGAIGFATVIVISVIYHFWKNKRDSKFNSQMQNKLKEIK
ncbi:EGF-like domain-containing protein [Dictyostelium discoideum AX4]|uniref:EGF-like domain-containing protein n=1 Tax=Dictyostelium discoideum TaxID=44689 RepID=Q54PE3_DICDI|nr:EGF-like domain-containing protein [Dictyostelium discoideum AX4]EAL65077.1 EGF-like domain-containing protein [Dictyostelium discoideum AX4]|eukprot:XP_638432.1 EGF-like domain-containing protein [Dictyostelium discoideum AX4]